MIHWTHVASRLRCIKCGASAGQACKTEDGESYKNGYFHAVRESDAQRLISWLAHECVTQITGEPNPHE